MFCRGGGAADIGVVVDPEELEGLNTQERQQLLEVSSSTTILSFLHAPQMPPTVYITAGGCVMYVHMPPVPLSREGIALNNSLVGNNRGLKRNVGWGCRRGCRHSSKAMLRRGKTSATWWQPKQGSRSEKLLQRLPTRTPRGKKTKISSSEITPWLVAATAICGPWGFHILCTHSYSFTLLQEHHMCRVHTTHQVFLTATLQPNCAYCGRFATVSTDVLTLPFSMVC